jgi:hypothetical protein
MWGHAGIGRAWPIELAAAPQANSHQLSPISGGGFPHSIAKCPDLEQDMELILIALVLFLLFGGGGYWGYRRWR